MSDARRQHWDRVYATKPADTVSWFQEEPAQSLALIGATGLGKDACIVDVGGGASLLVDRLVEQGYSSVSVLDIAETGLSIARARLGDRQSNASWLVKDVTRWSPPLEAFDLWHDRAVFHFLVEETDRAGYRRALDRGLKPGGFLILALFALTGPDMCSGLPVRRYSPEMLLAELGPGYELVDVRQQTHRTPAGDAQEFVWCLFRRDATKTADDTSGHIASSR
jgi:SAM-dependent methyltransferase